MDQDLSQLAFPLLLACAAFAWLLGQKRDRLGQLAQTALTWALVATGALGLYGLWSEVGQSTAQQSVFATEGRIELPRARDGHYYLTAEVNGTPITFTVDTGASEIVLSAADARSAGIDTENLAYIGRAYTANGEVRTAPIRLDSFAVGGIEDRRLRAFVNEGAMDGSLLGMSYLQRYSKIEITNGALTLTR
ncbi:TIGR02281 family clan AA aspartic protease [Rhodobacteraceae bacterium D3-12]|nr:TIGR02281 family clan AA aspartic protease [Rhodobacteraceae bacterium D3-12]